MTASLAVMTCSGHDSILGSCLRRRTAATEVAPLSPTSQPGSADLLLLPRYASNAAEDIFGGDMIDDLSATFHWRDFILPLCVAGVLSSRANQLSSSLGERAAIAHC